MEHRNTQLYQLVSEFSTYVRDTYYPEVAESDWQIKGQVFGFRAAERLNHKIKHRPRDPRLLIRYHWLNASHLLIFKLDGGDSQDCKNWEEILKDVISFLSSHDVSCVISTGSRFYAVGNNSVRLQKLVNHLWMNYKKPKGIFNYVFVPLLQDNTAKINLIADGILVASLESTDDIDAFVNRSHQIRNQINKIKQDVYALLSSQFGCELERFKNENKFTLFGVSISFWVKHKVINGNSFYNVRMADERFQCIDSPDVSSLATMAKTYAKAHRLVNLFK